MTQPKLTPYETPTLGTVLGAHVEQLDGSLARYHATDLLAELIRRRVLRCAQEEYHAERLQLAADPTGYGRVVEETMRDMCGAFLAKEAVTIYEDAGWVDRTLSELDAGTNGKRSAFEAGGHTFVGRRFVAEALVVKLGIDSIVEGAKPPMVM